jgi:2,5-diamino-6-(ribosylamino)-4(3H)-pyrimidinone 5'-phosphate reductase
MRKRSNWRSDTMKLKVILHNSVSLDGRITGFFPEMGLHYQLVGTWEPDVHLTGSGTMLAMEEEVEPETEEDLKAPEEPASDDTRNMLVIADSKGKVRFWHFLRKQPFWKKHMALVSGSTPSDYIDYLEKRHIPYIQTGEDRVDFKTALEELNTSYGVETVLLDSGGTLNGVLLGQGLVDEISLLVHPVLVGGESPLTVFKGEEKHIQLDLIGSEEVEKGFLWLRYNVLGK